MSAYDCPPHPNPYQSPNGRGTRRGWLPCLVAGLVVAVCLLTASVAGAQTTTTTPESTTTTATTEPSTTSAPETTTPPTSSPVTTTPPTTAPQTTSSDDSFPWWVVVLGVVVLAAIVGGLFALSQRRARGRAGANAWRQRAADAIGEVGGTARLLAGGTPVSAAIAQQMLTSLRTLDDLTESAPDDYTRSVTHDAREAVRSLAIAIDADRATRTAQPPASQPQLEAAAAGLRSAAMDAESVLRHAYRTLTPVQ